MLPFNHIHSSPLKFGVLPSATRYLGLGMDAVKIRFSCSWEWVYGHIQISVKYSIEDKDKIYVLEK